MSSQAQVEQISFPYRGWQITATHTPGGWVTQVRRDRDGAWGWFAPKLTAAEALPLGLEFVNACCTEAAIKMHTWKNEQR